MKASHTVRALAVTAAGSALLLFGTLTAPTARAEVRTDPNNDYKVMKFLATGDTPYIDFTTTDGEVITNDSLKGKLAVIDVWATWCPPCIESLPHFKSLVEDYGDSDKIEFIGVSMDKDMPTLEKGIEQYGITWKQVLDEKRNLNTAWNQGMLPTIAIIAPTGESVFVGHPNDMDAPFQQALKKYVPDKYDPQKEAEAMAKAEAAAKAREAAAAKRRAELEAQAKAAYKPGSFPLKDLNLVDIDGNPITAEQLNGKVVVMDFWASWCGPCMASMPHTKELYAKHHDADGLEVIGMNRDRALDDLLKAKEKVGMPWMHYFDQDGSIAKKFNVTGIPHVFIFSRKGEMLWQGHPMSMDEPLARALADDSLTAKDFVKPDDGKPKSVPMMSKTPAMPAAKPASVPAAMIKPVKVPKEVMQRVLLDVGAKPTFSFTCTDGTTVTNESLKGHIVVMDFWATWCGPCMAAVPHMVEVQKEYSDAGVKVIGISLDKSEDTLKKTVADKNMTWPQHYDGDRTVTKQFGVSAIPTVYILSPDGEVLWRGHPDEMDEQLAKAIEGYKPIG